MLQITNCQKAALAGAILLLSGGCSVHQAALTPPADYDLTKLRSQQRARPDGVVTGEIVEVFEGGTRRSPGACVCLDGDCHDRSKPALGCYMSNANGTYARTLSPGVHTLQLKWLGWLPSPVVKFTVEPGDSVRLNFRLKQDTRPTVN